MEKIQIQDVIKCNKTLCKMLEQRTTFSISLGLKLIKIMKNFEEAEDYIFEIMDIAFPNLQWDNMSDKEIEFYNKLITEEIEMDFEKIPKKFFENNEKLMLSLEDINNLSIILCEN